MKLTKDEFKSLQLEWYGRLKASGFNDIEKFSGGELILAQSANYAVKTLDALTRYMRSEYFTSLGHAANNEQTLWRNEIDKYILIRYCEGARIKDIVNELIALKTPRNRKSVRIIIRRYEMAWGFRVYPPNLLNKY